MQTICPAYEGSVRTSWYPVIAVLKTTSPSPATSAPRATPTNARPSSSTSAAWVLAGNDDRLVDPVLLVDEDFDPLRVGRRHILADVVGPDGQLAMPSIDEDRELDRARPAEIHQCVHRRACGPAAAAHVIDEGNHLAAAVRQLGRDGSPIARQQLSDVRLQRAVEPSNENREAMHPDD